jgi:hypothetical protein
MSNQTPIQKSIAEIEAKIAITKKQIEDAVGVNPTLLRLYSVQFGLEYAINILTANLEYERGVIVQAWTDGTYGIGDNAHDYYTKTYNNEPKN